MRLTNAKRSNLNASWLALVSGRQVTSAGNPFLRFRSVLDLVRRTTSLFCPEQCPGRARKYVAALITLKGNTAGVVGEAALKVMRFK